MSDRKEKFTPGPWRVHLDKRNGTVCSIIEDKSGDCVANTFPRYPRGERNANGYLIAAAPEMRENMIDNLTTIDLINSTALQICADCKWERQCKTCALSEVFRLLNGIQERTEKLKKEVDGEE